MIYGHRAHLSLPRELLVEAEHAPLLVGAVHVAHAAAARAVVCRVLRRGVCAARVGGGDGGGGKREGVGGGDGAVAGAAAAEGCPGWGMSGGGLVEGDEGCGIGGHRGVWRC